VNGTVTAKRLLRDKASKRGGNFNRKLNIKSGFIERMLTVNCEPSATVGLIGSGNAVTNKARKSFTS
jgi:hypothetical protein